MLWLFDQSNNAIFDESRPRPSGPAPPAPPLLLLLFPPGRKSTRISFETETDRYVTWERQSINEPVNTGPEAPPHPQDATPPPAATQNACAHVHD